MNTTCAGAVLPLNWVEDKLMDRRGMWKMEQKLKEKEKLQQPRHSATHRTCACLGLWCESKGRFARCRAAHTHTRPTRRRPIDY